MFFADRKSRNTTTGTGWALNQKVYCDAIAKLGVKHKHWPFCLKAKGQSETAICFISTWPWCLLPPLLRQHIFHWILLWRVLEAQILMTCLDLVLFAPTARTRFRAVRFTWFHDIPKSSCLWCIVFPPRWCLLRAWQIHFYFRLRMATAILSCLVGCHNSSLEIFWPAPLRYTGAFDWWRFGIGRWSSLIVSRSRIHKAETTSRWN